MRKGNFKVRCIRDYNPGIWLTKGKVYEFTDGATTFDDGFRPAWAVYDSYEDWKKGNPNLAASVELISDKKQDNPTQTITIRHKSNRVIAVLTDADGNFIKSAKARYNPNDALEGKPFDFEVGKRIAVRRLLGESGLNTTLDGKKIVEAVHKTFARTLKPLEKPVPTSFDWQSFKSGKFAVHCDTEEKAKEFLKECDEQGIKWCTNTKISDQKETRWNNRKNNTSYGCDSFGGLMFGAFDNRPKIDYAPSRPAIKEIKPEEPKPKTLADYSIQEIAAELVRRYDNA